MSIHDFQAKCSWPYDDIVCDSMTMLSVRLGMTNNVAKVTFFFDKRHFAFLIAKSGTFVNDANNFQSN
jgi:hypothetical protein